MPFWASIGLLSLAQGAIVALPGAWSAPALRGLRSRLWAIVPAGSVIVFVAVGTIAADGSAHALTYLALLAVPLLAALALSLAMRRSRPLLALAVVPLFALAWLYRADLAGQAAALSLSGLSCVALGVLIAAVTPPRWLAVGIVGMATADAALVVAELLQRPDTALNAAHPAAGLPRLQVAILGSASMGYGDLFVAGLLGGLLAANVDGREQARGALLATLLALAFDLLFFVVDELPATVPVAAALVLLSGRLPLAPPSPRRARRRAAARSPRSAPES
jgi:hypothetical protein